MIDFTSALYLGFKHSSAELAGWLQLTTGKPAALHEFDLSREVSRNIANMQGLQEGVAAPSTLHLYWDLFGFLRNKKITVFIDEKIYAVSKYGIERLQLSGIKIHTFRHLCANHLFEIVKAKLQKNRIPVILTDGWCPMCGKAAPLNEYTEIITSCNGVIIIDDTQAFGIFGERKTAAMYGKGGGGIVKWLNVRNSNIITVTSLAKAFGVPMAVMSGNKQFIEAFRQNSETRVNSSPVSAAHLAAALHALQINKTSGDAIRRKLWNNVAFFRTAFMQSGLNVSGGIFPVQSITNQTTDAIIKLFHKLDDSRIKTVLTSGHIQTNPALSFIITSEHSLEELQEVTDRLAVIKKKPPLQSLPVGALT